MYKCCVSYLLTYLLSTDWTYYIITSRCCTQVCSEMMLENWIVGAYIDAPSTSDAQESGISDNKETTEFQNCTSDSYEHANSTSMASSSLNPYMTSPSEEIFSRTSRLGASATCIYNGDDDIDSPFVTSESPNHLLPAPVCYSSNISARWWFYIIMYWLYI